MGMSDDLQAALEDIDGVGEATAEAILKVLADHDTDSEPSGYLAKAIDAAENGDDRQAGIYLRRHVGGE